MKYIKLSFKAMPFGVKFFFFIALYSLLSGIVNVTGMKEINYSYFGTSFPRNYPLIWYAYVIGWACFELYVLLKRSFSLLKKMVIIYAAILIIGAIDSIVSFYTLLPQQKALFVILAPIGYGFSIFIIVYLLRQRKYFYKS